MRYPSGVDPVYHSGSLSFVATFAEPAFDLPYAGSKLHRRVYRALREFDIDKAGLQENKPQTGPNSWSLSLNFLSFAAALKVRVDGFEVTFISDCTRDIDLHRKVLKAVEEAIFQTEPHTSPSRRILHQQIHCELTDDGLIERIPWFKRDFPEELGNLRSQGIGLYFTNPLFSGRANVVLDNSLVVDEGLFVQTRCEFEASEFDLSTCIDNFQKYLASLEDTFALQGILGGVR